VITACNLIGVALIVLGVYLTRTRGHAHDNLFGALGSFLTGVSPALDHDWFGIGLAGIGTACWLYLWWHNGGGKDLKKAARELGDESRQRIQALVNALQPVPARAAA